MRQRNMSQIKEQEEKRTKELNKMKTSNLPDAEFKTPITMMLNELIRERTDDLSENFNKEIGNKENQADMKNKITEMKKTSDGINIR